MTKKIFLQQSQAQLIPNMFMPYIEGPKIDWTVYDGLYNRFLKWHLKCENILECELVKLSERRKCKKVIAWSCNLAWTMFCGAHQLKN